MQSLRANQQTVYYSLYLGMTDVLNASGYKTGEKLKAYSTPQPIRIFVSPAKGTAEIEQFGVNSDYTNVMSTFDTNCPIVEDTILWIGVTPEDQYTPYTHRVTKVAKWKNSILYAIKEVKVQNSAPVPEVASR